MTAALRWLPVGFAMIGWPDSDDVDHLTPNGVDVVSLWCHSCVMDITSYTERLRREINAATALGSDELRSLAERLIVTVDPAVRIVLMEALSDAAAEISAEMPHGSVDARLRAGQIEFVLDGFDNPVEEPGATEPDDASEDVHSGDLVRLTLRLPANLKTKAEEFASARGHSLNTWLIEAVRASVRGPALPPEPPAPPVPGRSGRRMSGWA